MRIIGADRRRITLENIRNAFPEKDSEWHRKLVSRSYHNLGIVLAEILAFKSLSDDKIRKYIRYENIGLINELIARGKGLILLSGHFGNWEFLAYSAGFFSGVQVTIIVKPQKNKLADRFINKIRTRRNNSVVSMYKAAREIITVLRKGESIALLADQSASPQKNVFIEFFGRPAATYKAPAELSLKFDCPIIMGFAERQADGTYFVKLKEIEHSDLEDTPENVEVLTKRHVVELEQAIRKNPDHWPWQHRRWKHSEMSEKNEQKTQN